MMTNIGVISVIGAIAMSLVSTPGFADQTALPGYAEGAQVVRIDKTEGQIDTITGIIYSQVLDTRSVRALRMSLLVPRTKDLKPAVVYYPGGGFTSASHDKYIEMRSALAKAGFVVAAVEYRTVPDKFPALLEDGKAAVRYLRAHATQLGIDPSRIGVLGDSAGGYLSQMMGLTNGDKSFDRGDFIDQSSEVQAVATLYGISNLLNIGEGFAPEIEKVHASPAVTEALLVHGPAFATFAGAAITSDADKALKASPMGHLEGSKPPFLIMHGSSDTLVSPVQSKQLFEALKARNDKADYILIDGAAHGDVTWYQPPVIQSVVDWFLKSLGTPIKGGGVSAGPAANL